MQLSYFYYICLLILIADMEMNTQFVGLTNYELSHRNVLSHKSDLCIRISKLLNIKVD